jgi:hypothetical protein
MDDLLPESSDSYSKTARLSPYEWLRTHAKGQAGFDEVSEIHLYGWQCCKLKVVASQNWPKWLR